MRGLADQLVGVIVYYNIPYWNLLWIFIIHRSQQYEPSNNSSNENPHWAQARKALEKAQEESSKNKSNQENSIQNNAHMNVFSNNPNAAYYYQQVSYFQNRWVL